jgi:hypothetical protein
MLQKQETFRRYKQRKSPGSRFLLGTRGWELCTWELNIVSELSMVSDLRTKYGISD